MTTVFDPTKVQVRTAEVGEVTLGDEVGLVEVKLAPYEVEAELGPGLSEVFTRGCFAAAVGNPSRLVVSDQGHNRQVTIGRAKTLRDEADGIYGTLRIPMTAAGRDVLTLMRAEVLTDMSVEFRMAAKGYEFIERKGGTLLRHNRATLIGVSPVGVGAYGEDARVLSVRDAEAEKRREAELAHWLAEPEWTRHLPRA